MKIKKIIIYIAIFLLSSCMSSMSNLERSYIKIAEQVLPSVVEVITIGVEEDKENRWYDFFKDQEENRRDDFESSGLGSGVIIESKNNDYFIITNSHVIGDSKEVTIVTNNQVSYKGIVIGSDERFDLSVVKINSDEKLPVAELKITNDVKVGQFVAALGAPMGYSQSVSMGIVSHKGRYGGPKNNISSFIQTDASINQGNSGGPLVNTKGEVVGINTWISSPSGGSVGLGFAVPLENIYPSVRSIIDTGSIKKSWIGISTGQVPNSSYYSNKKGSFIYQVVYNSPAYINDLKPGDIITEANNKIINSSQDLILELSLLKPGESVLLKINRDSNDFVIDITLTETEENILEISKKIIPGFLLKEEEASIKLLQVLSKSLAQTAGFKKDDIVRKINNIDINTTQDVYNSLKKGKNKVIISRDEEELELELNY